MQSANSSFEDVPGVFVHDVWEGSGGGSGGVAGSRLDPVPVTKNIRNRFGALDIDLLKRRTPLDADFSYASEANSNVSNLSSLIRPSSSRFESVTSPRNKTPLSVSPTLLRHTHSAQICEYATFGRCSSVRTIAHALVEEYAKKRPRRLNITDGLGGSDPLATSSEGYYGVTKRRDMKNRRKKKKLLRITSMRRRNQAKQAALSRPGTPGEPYSNILRYPEENNDFAAPEEILSNPLILSRLETTRMQIKRKYPSKIRAGSPGLRLKPIKSMPTNLHPAAQNRQQLSLPQHALKELTPLGEPDVVVNVQREIRNTEVDQEREEIAVSAPEKGQQDGILSVKEVEEEKEETLDEFTASRGRVEVSIAIPTAVAESVSGSASEPAPEPAAELEEQTNDTSSCYPEAPARMPISDIYKVKGDEAEIIKNVTAEDSIQENVEEIEEIKPTSLLLAPGTKVVLHSLKNAVHNGKVVVVEEFAQDTGRYQVCMDGVNRAGIKPVNIRPQTLCKGMFLKTKMVHPGLEDCMDPKNIGLVVECIPDATNAIFQCVLLFEDGSTMTVNIDQLMVPDPYAYMPCMKRKQKVVKTTPLKEHEPLPAPPPVVRGPSHIVQSDARKKQEQKSVFEGLETTESRDDETEKTALRHAQENHNAKQDREQNQLDLLDESRVGEKINSTDVPSKLPPRPLKSILKRPSSGSASTKTRAPIQDENGDDHTGVSLPKLPPRPKTAEAFTPFPRYHLAQTGMNSLFRENMPIRPDSAPSSTPLDFERNPMNATLSREKAIELLSLEAEVASRVDMLQKEELSLKKQCDILYELEQDTEARLQWLRDEAKAATVRSAQIKQEETELECYIIDRVCVDTVHDLVAAVEEWDKQVREQRPPSRSLEFLNGERDRLIKEGGSDAQIKMCRVELRLCRDLLQRLHSVKILLAPHYEVANVPQISSRMTLEKDDDVSCMVGQTRQKLKNLTYRLREKLEVFCRTPERDLARVMKEMAESSKILLTNDLVSAETAIDSMEIWASACSVVIQKQWRGIWGRQRYHRFNQVRLDKRLREKNRQMTSIQCMVRQHQAKKRARWKRLLKEMKAEIRKRRLEKEETNVDVRKVEY